MSKPAYDEVSIMARFDRSTPESLLKSIASELSRLYESNAQLAAKVQAMESLSAMADHMFASEVELETEYPSSLRIDADQSFVDGHGFYPMEYDVNGLPYRWTGPSRQFSFEVFVAREVSLRVLLVFDDLFVRRPLEELRCLVDGEPIALRSERVGKNCLAGGVLAPRKAKGATIITFVCPQTGSPQEAGQTDRRMLGLSFRTLAVGPLDPSDDDEKSVARTPAL